MLPWCTPKEKCWMFWSPWLEKWIFNTLSYCRSIARASFAVAVIFLETVEFMQSFMRLSFITQFKIFYYHLPVVETCLKKWLLGPFFQNQGTFFDFQKRAGEAFPLPPSCVPVNAAECASIFLNNIPKCPWKCLNK